MRTGAKRTSKAAMVAEKDRAIVLAAHDHFLRDGFAGASMDAIAKSAGVSVKTIYSHFANKDELFSNVMIAACTDHLLSNELPPDPVIAERFAWFREATQRGLMEAGREYLRHLLSEEQLALYRVVTRDADRFPDLGRQYHKNVARGRTGILVAYLRSIARRRSWTKRDATQDAALYEALLRAGIYEEVLHGLVNANSETIKTHARLASKTMWKLLTANGE
ncbi:TetR/AcrR family transcriptional regulator [Granulicella sp. S156]|uniref:TetR/AcrR family transcriptional regulator n=1 Tax=Granulicella sp. S156 TaxID=1747224 RepID=UPI00131D1755|nr:TetR/AcrR family transcriptional regulator [Granulicella sp. S156]